MVCRSSGGMLRSAWQLIIFNETGLGLPGDRNRGWEVHKWLIYIIVVIWGNPVSYTHLTLPTMAVV